MLTYIKFVLCVLLCYVTELYIVVSLVYSVLMFTATFKDESAVHGEIITLYHWYLLFNTIVATLVSYIVNKWDKVGSIIL